jgi:hypothetical protein
MSDSQLNMLFTNFAQNTSSNITPALTVDTYRHGIGHILHGYKLPNKYPTSMLQPLQKFWSSASEDEKDAFVSMAIKYHPPFRV